MNEEITSHPATDTTHCWVDLNNCQLTLRKESEEVVETIFDLPAIRKAGAPRLSMSNQSLCAFDPTNDSFRTAPWEIDNHRYGFSLREKNYLYQASDGLPQSYFHETSCLIFPGVYTKRPAQGPYDLFVSENQKWLAVINRREAIVQIFDTEQHTLKSEQTFEALQGEKVITVAMDTLQQRVFICGADARKVLCWHLENNEVSPLEGPWKHPTHVLLNATNLWVLDSHKKSCVHRVQLETQELKTIEITGGSYAHLTATPADLMRIDNENQCLFTLTHQPLPDPLTPVVSIVDTDVCRIHSESQPSQRSWPALLTSASINPEYQAIMKRQREFVPEETSTVVKALLASFGLSLQQFKSKLLIINAKASPALDLPTRARDFILTTLQNRMQQEHGVQLSPSTSQNGKSEAVIHAEQLAQLLRTHDHIEAVIYNLAGQYTIQLELHRKDLFEQLQSAGISVSAGPETVKKVVEAAPTYAKAHLEPGQMTLADPLNNRLIQLDSKLKVVWELDASGLENYRPVDFIWLGERFVIHDAESGEASCWNLSAKQEWQVQSNDNHWNQIRFLESSGLILGLDTNLGCLEAVDSRGEMQWKIETAVIDCATTTTDIWVLYANAELKKFNEKGTLQDEFQLSGTPAVLAVSEKNIAVFDPKAQIIELIHIETLESTTLATPVSSPRYKITEPGGMKWVEQDCVIYDAFRLLKVNTEKQSVSAAVLMQDLRVKSPKDNKAPTHIFQLRAANSNKFQGGNQNSLIEMLKKVSLFHQAPPLFFDALSERIRTRVYNRGEAIVSKGETGKEMYLIRQGEVEVMDPKQASAVASMASGDVFGEVALMTGQKRNATVRAKGYCEVFSLDQAELDQILPDYPEVRERLIQLSETRSMQEQLRSESERARVQQRLNELQNQRKQVNTRKDLSKQASHRKPLNPVDTAQSSTSSFEIWVRNTAKAELLKLNSKGEILAVIGDKNWVQPVQVVEGKAFTSVLDMGQNQVFQYNLSTRDQSPLADLGLVQARDMCIEGDHLWIANTGKSELLKITPHGEVVKRLSHGRAPASVHSHNGELVVTDVREHTVSRLNKDGEVVWRFGTPRKLGRDEKHLFSPEYAQILTNGNVLITDTGNSRILEVDAEGRIAWALLSGAGLRMMRPTRSLRLENGNTLIEHSSRSQWIEIGNDLRLLWRYQVNQK